ncbi:hypothetical protein ACPOL_2658 [Acidisarcina polymorpha]|uniref:Uncharacterized protein n=1 Tax=Acidisarcina polymorpha TaxID=2211140 RepID=A0A2Z5FYN9_9BACT|nr:hypothetical protein ACPOL_2658 [Acidisarcina polymorpha]
MQQLEDLSERKVPASSGNGRSDGAPRNAVEWNSFGNIPSFGTSGSVAEEFAALNVQPRNTGIDDPK